MIKLRGFSLLYRCYLSMFNDIFRIVHWDHTFAKYKTKTSARSALSVFVWALQMRVYLIIKCVFSPPSYKDVLVSSSCPNKIPLTGWLKQNTFIFFTVLEARKSKIKVPVDLVRTCFLACRQLLFLNLSNKILLKCSWFLQYCVNFSCTAKWFSYTLYIYSFSYSFLLWVITGYWM